jgi:hypothetical protein
MMQSARISAKVWVSIVFFAVARLVDWTRPIAFVVNFSPLFWVIFDGFTFFFLLLTDSIVPPFFYLHHGCKHRRCGRCRTRILRMDAA